MRNVSKSKSIVNSAASIPFIKKRNNSVVIKSDGFRLLPEKIKGILNGKA